MEITNEFKVRAIINYMGSCALYGYEGNRKTGTITGNNSITGIEIFDTSRLTHLHHTVNPELIQIMLMPLSEISERHAAYAAQILDVTYSNNPESEAHFDITGLAFYLQELFEKNGDIREVASWRIIKLADFLRSKSYHIPFMGEDLYESGIAIKLLTHNSDNA